MNAQTEIKKKLNIDKSAWTLVKLGDVVTEPRDTVKDFTKENIEHVVGLEHINPEDVHLRRSSSIEESTTFTKKFKKGDVLFGRRRAYLKKAAQASFEGICSGDITVMRVKEGLLPELLPFVINNEHFFDYAVKHSAGGLSPRVKWRDLANYQFLLPPKEQQAQLAELLWAMDEVVEREREVLSKLKFCYDVLNNNLFTKQHKNWEYMSLNKIADINKKSLKPNTDPNYKFKYLDIAGIIEPKVIGELKTTKFSESPSRARRIVDDDSIVLSLVRPYHQCFVFLKEASNIIASTGTGVVKVKKPLNCRFIFHQFFSQKFLKYCENRMTGTNYPAITSSDLEKYTIGVPLDNNQVNIETERLDNLDESISSIRDKISTSKSLQKSLINQTF